MSQKEYDSKPRWYVVHTYSGYENKVKTENYKNSFLILLYQWKSRLKLKKVKEKQI